MINKYEVGDQWKQRAFLNDDQGDKKKGGEWCTDKLSQGSTLGLTLMNTHASTWSKLTDTETSVNFAKPKILTFRFRISQNNLVW